MLVPDVVFTQRFPVVARHDEGGRLGRALLFDLIPQATDQLVRVRDACAVEPSREGLVRDALEELAGFHVARRADRGGGYEARGRLDRPFAQEGIRWAVGGVWVEQVDPEEHGPPTFLVPFGEPARNGRERDRTVAWRVHAGEQEPIETLSQS